MHLKPKLEAAAFKSWFISLLLLPPNQSFHPADGTPRIFHGEMSSSQKSLGPTTLCRGRDSIRELHLFEGP